MLSTNVYRTLHRSKNEKNLCVGVFTEQALSVTMVTNLEGSRHGQTEWLDHDGLLEPLESESESFSGVSVQDGGGRVGKGS